MAREEGIATREDGFTALVERQSRFVFRVAYSILRNVHDADDVVQETFLKLYRLRAWERAANERAFLARMAWRIAVGQLRTRHGNTPGVEAASSVASPEQAAIKADWNALVCRLTDSLPEELRQPLVLSAVEELSSREIAGIMGIPDGTVRRRLMRARQLLKEKLNSLGAGRHEER